MKSTYQRWVLAATLIVLCNGCGDKQLDEPLPKTSQSISVKVPWPDGGKIPRQYTCDGGDSVPAVSEPKPYGATVMTDPDAPGGTFVHWTRWGAKQGENSFGKKGYSGPCPPKGDSPHHYVFTVYKLNKPLGLEDGAPADEVVAAIKKDASASGSATGTYGR